MKHKFITLGICLALSFSTVACAGGERKAETSAQEDVGKVTYQTILEEYRQKLSAAVPGLVEEFHSEIVGKEGDPDEISEISTAKEEELSQIAVEGIQKMSELAAEDPETDESKLEEWTQELHNVFDSTSETLHRKLAEDLEQSILDAHNNEDGGE